MLYLIIFISVLTLINSQPTPICQNKCVGGVVDGELCSLNPDCEPGGVCAQICTTNGNDLAVDLNENSTPSTPSTENGLVTDDVNMLIGIGAAALAFSVCACLIVCVGCCWWGYSNGKFPMEVLE